MPTTKGTAIIFAATGVTQFIKNEISKLDITKPKEVTITNFVYRLKTLFFFLKFSTELAKNEIKEAIATERIFAIKIPSC